MRISMRNRTVRMAGDYLSRLLIHSHRMVKSASIKAAGSVTTEEVQTKRCPTRSPIRYSS